MSIETATKVIGIIGVAALGIWVIAHVGLMACAFASAFKRRPRAEIDLLQQRALSRLQPLFYFATVLLITFWLLKKAFG